MSTIFPCFLDVTAYVAGRFRLPVKIIFKCIKTNFKFNKLKHRYQYVYTSKTYGSNETDAD